jgi:hypothetical protein
MKSDEVKVYEVIVFAVAEGRRDRQIGSWRGPADSELKAKEFAEVDCWTQNLTEEGYSPSHGLRVMPRYLKAERWFHSWDGATEGVIRWAYDRADGEVVHAAALRPDGAVWAPLTKGQLMQLRDALEEVFDVDGNPDDFEGVEEVEVLPEWAAQPQAPRRPKP